MQITYLYIYIFDNLWNDLQVDNIHNMLNGNPNVSCSWLINYYYYTKLQKLSLSSSKMFLKLQNLKN